MIRLQTEKTGEQVAVAVSDILAAAIEAGPVGQMTFIVGAGGKPMVKEAFGNIFREWCNAAGVSKSAHGARKAAATADAMDGFSDAELDAKFGWTGRKMAARYTRTANRETAVSCCGQAGEIENISPAPNQKCGNLPKQIQ